MAREGERRRGREGGRKGREEEAEGEKGRDKKKK